ncbi:MAG: GAF domain-containing sensor histidine kinase [Bacteroidota bacterium]|nr:GAF domain-containing sensor histidine kinase [Bacteroidota bacterium]
MNKKINVEEKDSILSIINEVLSTYISTHSSFESLIKLLDFLLLYTESEFGFIGEILYDVHGERYLKSHAITNIAWDKETLDLYTKHVSTGLEFRNNNSIFGVTVKTGEAYISKDPASDPNKAGTPKGHPPMSSFIGIPIYNKDIFIGMIGLANKKGGYHPNTITQLEPFYMVIASILQSFKIYKINEENKLKLQKNERNLIAVITSIEDEVIETNKQFEVLNYWTSSSMQINVSFVRNILDLLPPKYENEIKQCIIDVLEKEKKVHFEFKKESNWYGLSFTLNKSELNPTVTILVQNISKRKEAELNLLKRIEDDQIKLLKRSEFLDIASHELKSPMATILSTIELVNYKLNMNKETRIDEIQRYLKIIQSESERAKGIVHDFLEIGKLDSQTNNLKKEKIHLPTEIEAIIENYKIQYPNAKVNISLDAEIKPIYSDKNLLSNALNNVISNAFKYSKTDIQVNISVYQHNAKTEIVVEDKGIGIPEKDKENIFKPFYRANTKHADGNGLGLMILKQSMDKLNGQIKIESEENVGTTVKLIFPE